VSRPGSFPASSRDGGGGGGAAVERVAWSVLRARCGAAWQAWRVEIDRQ